MQFSSKLPLLTKYMPAQYKSRIKSNRFEWNTNYDPLLIYATIKSVKLNSIALLTSHLVLIKKSLVMTSIQYNF